MIIQLYLLCCCLVTILSTPVDEFMSNIKNGELTPDSNAHLMGIVPSGFSFHKTSKRDHEDPPEINLEDTERLKKLIHLVNRGAAMKDLTFNIYNDEMREVAVTLFYLLKECTEYDYNQLMEWAEHRINRNLVDYVKRLLSIYSEHVDPKELLPPFILKPNYFINAETIRKATMLKLSNGRYGHQEGIVNQYFRIDDVIAINTNYSGWNLQNNVEHRAINYFTEDIALNSYYYGLHLLHPFWMSNDELDEIDPRHAEHYYYKHQQLFARYMLEMGSMNLSIADFYSDSNSYDSYLVHDNGLPFPTRHRVKYNNINIQLPLAKIKTIDIGIREMISRGFMVMNKEGKIELTENNYIVLLSKLIRTNYDGINGNLIRMIFAYGTEKYLLDGVDPAPSTLHFPETSLRDPVYWYMIHYALNYYTECQKLFQPYDIMEYSTDDFNILTASLDKLVTYFDYYQLSIDYPLKIIQKDFKNLNTGPSITARQRRLKSMPFSLNFTVEANENSDGIVRLFLGPQCYLMECWLKFNQFYELDNFKQNFVAGRNNVTWKSTTSNRYSTDEFYNMEQASLNKNHYDILKFPLNLLLPKGSKHGYNVTLFVMITHLDKEHFQENQFDYEYRKTMHRFDGKPLGFPFHRSSNRNLLESSNFKFYNVTIFHKEEYIFNNGYFSRNLY